MPNGEVTPQRKPRPSAAGWSTSRPRNNAKERHAFSARRRIRLHGARPARASCRGTSGRFHSRRHRECRQLHDVDRLPGFRIQRSSVAGPRVAAFEYSDAYKTRAKIHKYASFATLPLFATEFALGQSLYNTPSDSKKSAHIAVGSGIIGLYAVQGVTGLMNLLEAKKDPNPDGKKRRLTHAVLMLASGAGFAITPMVAPGHRDQLEFGSGSASTHRAVAFTSIGIGTAGYLLMLFGGK